MQRGAILGFARFLAACTAAAFVVLPGGLRAQGAGTSTPTATPDEEEEEVLSPEEEEAEEDIDRELYIKNIVHTATKAVTTVQEAPAVIHIFTAEDIEAFGFRNLIQTLSYIPGFLEANAQYDQMPIPSVLGMTQSVLYLRDGLSQFDPVFNIQANMRRIPLETIKRIEVSTSPGGVLWGANSFLGIVNVITKDPADVNGLEISVGGGHGPGDEMVIRPYVMYGKSFLRGQFQVLVHWSVEWFKGPRYRMPEPTLYSPPPRPNGPLSYRHVDGLETLVPVSMFSQLDGKILYAKPRSARQLSLVWQFTFSKVPGLWSGLHKPMSFIGLPIRSDSPNPILRENNLDWGESYAFLQYKDRWIDSKLGLNTKVYYLRFDRNLRSVMLPETRGVFNGLVFQTIGLTPQRTGMTLDMDFLVHPRVRLLWGGEVFYEWVRDADVEFLAPTDEHGQLDYSKLSVVCPYYNVHGDGLPVYDPNNPDNTTYVPGCRQPFLFDTDRLVYGLFLSAQYRPHPKVILDGGIRLQHAPAGNATYSPQLLGSAAAVWNFYKEMYLKANFASGFRPPVFNNVSANGAAVQYAGNPDIKTERSYAVQLEWNAKLLKNSRYVKEWDLRLDYAYALLDGMIRIYQGSYVNIKRHDIHSAQLLSDLYLRGGHRFRLAYTFQWHQDELNLASAGIMRSVPNHWLAAGIIFRLFDIRGWRLDANSTFRLIGAFEDPDRLIRCPAGNTMNCSAKPADLTYDRIPPTALLNLGLRLRGRPGGYPVEFTANTYNVLNDSWWAGDYFYDLGARTEVVPTPGQKFYFFLKAVARF